eukprot:3932840-Rhodomonas_salina.4
MSVQSVEMGRIERREDLRCTLVAIDAAMVFSPASPIIGCPNPTWASFLQLFTSAESEVAPRS